MLSFLTLLSTICGTYIQSLKKDLAKAGFEIILLVVSIAWVDLLFLFGLVAMGWFEMPTDIWFYVFWLGVTGLYTIQFIFFVTGLKETLFLAANTFPNLGFAVTAIYAVLILGERITPVQIIAIVIALAGSLLFFEWNTDSKIKADRNTGLLFILFSVLIAPLGGIFYKSATLHTSSYHQFLTGRFVMDALYYSVFFLAVFAFWYRKNPWPRITALFVSGIGAGYMITTALRSLLDSWLIFKLPISLFTILGSISIPAGYVIGKLKYRERVKPRHIFGGLLIIFAIILFVLKNFVP